MLTTVTTLAALTLAPPAAALQQTDTTVPVATGARLEVRNYGGEIGVKTWNKNAVRIEASHSSRDRVVVQASDQLVHIKSSGRHGASQMIDYNITVPATMALSLSGVYTDITVQGVVADITAETVQGDVKVSGGSGTVSLKSVQGVVTLDNAKGRIDLNSVNETIKATDVSGDLSVETVNGDIVLRRIESANTEANTVSGSIVYEGTIKDAGRYRFATHNGDVRISIPEKANVSVSISTFNGDFKACFPVELTGKTKHRFNFTIGSGSARLEVEAFDGNIKLCRPGQLGKDKDKEKEEDE